MHGISLAHEGILAMPDLPATKLSKKFWEPEKKNIFFFIRHYYLQRTLLNTARWQIHTTKLSKEFWEPKFFIHRTLLFTKDINIYSALAGTHYQIVEEVLGAYVCVFVCVCVYVI